MEEEPFFKKAAYLDLEKEYRGKVCLGFKKMFRHEGFDRSLTTWNYVLRKANPTIIFTDAHNFKLSQDSQEVLSAFVLKHILKDY